MTASPLVITLTVDEEAQEAWDVLRRTWFPRHRLKIGAHVTLFHALPGEHLDRVLDDCLRIASRTPRFELSVPGVRSLGRGVALVLSSPELLAMHGELRQLWREWLSPQDAQPLKPHVTIQNKVDHRTAAATLETLRSDFGPSTAMATGLAVWRYLGGPWEALARCSFDRRDS
ncbi:2'-5' RNA ligase family protein [Amycolatopsis decaplanina]|uniref:Phosphoesterase HXTX n=1 Tax=Amycolatopsis decaplanina DSM 44594 TaxID=1284240 RepID=M2YW46_9PSEU|nr:2'-5' RNA ligase family protein [Amycolatopsis decaplanina]EME52938.1 hypothetical protein H074_31497 [Amycolatopsis decaplanina DSM 44594]